MTVGIIMLIVSDEAGLMLEAESNLGRQSSQNSPGVDRGVLDDAKEAPEAGVGGIANALVHPALARGNDDARLSAETVEGDGDLGRVAAADGVGEDVDAMASVAEVEGSLSNADVRLNADEGDGGRR
jgi:hypothetical protein